MNDITYEIPSYCRNILTLLEQYGYRAYVAGGAVRDLITGKIPHDYDVATSARPEDVISIARENDIRMIIETGIKHGTVTLISEGKPIEITTFRNDGTYSDSRHPDSVEFSDCIDDDVKRRDFTMNALYLGSDGKVKDKVGGIKDIHDRILRAVGDPERRFTEDALRIMRGLRFASVLDLQIETETAKAMFRCRDLLSDISAERIFREFSDMVCGQAASRIIRENINILSVLLPEIKLMEGFDQKSEYHDLDLLEHTLKVLDNIPIDISTGKRDVVLAYAALLHDIGKPESVRLEGNMKRHEELGCDIVMKFADRMKFSNELKKTVADLVLYHDSFAEPTRLSVYRFMTEHDPDFIDLLAVLQRADIMAHSPIGRERIKQLEAIKEIREGLISDKVPLSVKDLAVDGTDLIRLGFPQGPIIGSVLNDIFQEVVSGNLDNDCELIFTFVAEKYL